MPYLVDVEATIDVPNMYEAPKVRLSYPGSAELGMLWSDLAAIGWIIPEQPPIPYQASAWVGDRGRTTEHEYRVEDFEIISTDWPIHEVVDRGMETVNLLRRLGVDVHMPISYLDFLRKTQLQQKASRESSKTAADGPGAVPDHRLPESAMPFLVPGGNVAEGHIAGGTTETPVMERPQLSVVRDHVEISAVPQPPVAPVQSEPVGLVVVDIPQIVMLSTKAWSVLQTEPGLEVYQSVVVPGRTRWVWSETRHHLATLGATLPDPRILFETVELGWQRTADEVPDLKMNPETDRVLWFIVHQFHEATTLVSFLHEQRDTSARIVPMSPLPNTTAFDDCFLVGAAVPATDFAKVGSKVVANYGDVIARGKPSPLADTAVTFSR